MNLKTLFLKLGGSLITDKQIPRTVRHDVLARLAGEIALAYTSTPSLRLVLGHGSGSFGHVAARKHQTRQGVTNAAGWAGFAEVWREAAELNQIVMRYLHQAGLPAMAFPPSAGLVSADSQVVSWNIEPLKKALTAGLLPVVYGDVVFDQVRGGTIFSTEDVFSHLAGEFAPSWIGLAGLETGVWKDFPSCSELVERITPAIFPEIRAVLGGSAATDVTGGMESKVNEMLNLVTRLPGSQVFIFSGVPAGNVAGFLSGDFPPGTRIAAA